jgi:hypothetical protein
MQPIALADVATPGRNAEYSPVIPAADASGEPPERNRCSEPPSIRQPIALK